MQIHFFLVVVKLIHWYIFSAVSVVPSNPGVGPWPRIKISVFIINMYRRTHINTKSYSLATKSAFRKWKSSFSIKSNTISRIFLLINISIFRWSTAPNKQFSKVVSNKLELKLIHKWCLCLLLFHEYI